MAQKIPVRFVNVVQLLSENNYGIYLFHLFCILAFQYLLLPVAIPALAKWPRDVLRIFWRAAN